MQIDRSRTSVSSVDFILPCVHGSSAPLRQEVALSLQYALDQRNQKSNLAFAKRWRPVKWRRASPPRSPLEFADKDRGGCSKGLRVAAKSELSSYRAKRDFSKTAEPSGEAKV